MRERENSNRKHKGMFRGSSTLALHPRLRHTKGFHLCKIPMDLSSVPHTYKPSDSQVPYTRKSTDSPRPYLEPRSSQPNSTQQRAHLPVSSRNKEQVFGDHNT